MKLRPFQEQVIEKIVREPFSCRALLALEMGLGKTAISLRALADFHFIDPHHSQTLVISPANLRLNWRREAETWLQFMPDTSAICIVKSNKSPIFGQLVIMSYEQAVKRYEQLKALKFATIIVDESHYIKNPKAKRTRAVVPLCRAAKRVLLLTGTPILNRPIELWAQLAALNKAPMNYKSFAKHFCNAHVRVFEYTAIDKTTGRPVKKKRRILDVSGASNIRELNNYLTQYAMIRILKKDVLDQLPEKLRVKLVIEGTGKTKDRSLIEDICFKCLEATNFSVHEAFKILRQKGGVEACIFKAYAELSEKKRVDAADVTVELASNELPLVVFAHHKTMISTIADALSAAKVTFGVIQGDTPHPRRQKIVDDFQAKKIQVALLSLTAASTGLTLTAAKDMLIVEQPWGLGLCLQAEDRIHRIGQDRGVLIRYLICENTLDEHIWKLNSEKAQLTGSILDNAPNTQFVDTDQQSLGSYWDLVKSILINLKEKHGSNPKRRSTVGRAA